MSVVPQAEAALIRPLPTDDEIARMVRLSKVFYASGIYRDVKQAEQAFAKMVIGRDLGLSIAQSMQGVQFVQGQIQLHYSMLAMVIRARGFWWETIERSETRAAARFFGPNVVDEGEEVEFTMANADTANLTKPARSGEASMYTKYPRNMLWARMMSDAVRFVIPEATGGIPVYAPGEVPETPELSEGEGSGEARGIELPQEVEEIIARAEELGHAGWAERSTWEYRKDRGLELLAASVAEAETDLADLAAKRDAIPDAVVEPDVPIDGADLPPVPPDVLESVREEAEAAGLGEAASEAEEPIRPEQADPGSVPSSEGVRSEPPAQDPSDAEPSAGADGGTPQPEASTPATYIEYLAVPDKNELRFRHLGCDGVGARWMVPLDDIPLPLARETEECAQCAHVLPVRAAKQEDERIASLGGGEVQTAGEPVPPASPAKAEGSAAGNSAVQDEDGVSIESYRHRLKTLQAKRPRTDEQKEMRDEEVGFIEEKIRALEAAEADSSTGQGALL